MSVIKPILQHPELIAYFLGANNYCWLYFRNGEKKLLAKPISFLENNLPDFIRVHKTVLLNPACVKSLHKPPRQKMAGEVHLENGEVFPISRRRWQQVVDSLQDRLELLNSAIISIDKPALSPSAMQSAQKETVEQSILLITDDKQNALLVKRSIENKWPVYQFQTAQQSSHLPDIFRQMPPQNYPTLLLLDARTTTRERLNTLQRLKEDPLLGRIPVILLVAPSDQSVIEGYKKQANSVISMPDRYNLLTQTVERVCQFWLQTVALPGTGR